MRFRFTLCQEILLVHARDNGTEATFANAYRPRPPPSGPAQLESDCRDSPPSRWLLASSPQTGRRSPTAGQSRRRSCPAAGSGGWETRLFPKSRPRIRAGGPVRRRAEQPHPPRPLPDRHSRDRTPDERDHPGTPEYQIGRRSRACQRVRLRRQDRFPSCGGALPPQLRPARRVSRGQVCHPPVRRYADPDRAGRRDDRRGWTLLSMHPRRPLPGSASRESPG